ncbi:hypothetical protein ACJ73_00902 [Blastomyces percursus]|uniref:Uncharacterized protein n=1 Tax=Blastomyces percursus TaxID=1658174 RepID=A0A1J9RJB7_9EURO|nr:hypothetical protein ACJ73_00902 [Blastomyces percursus]
MQLSLALVSFGLLGLSRAQKSIVTELAFPGPIDPQPIVASVVKADPTATVYSLECAPGTDDTECGVPGVSYTTSPPNKVAMGFRGYGEEGPSSHYLECNIQGPSADCTKVLMVSETGKGLSTSYAESTQIPASGFITPWKVTITAGLEKLEGATATPAPSSGASVTPTRSGTEAPPTGANAPTTDTSTGLAMPLATAAANWGAIGGAAVAVAALVM